jgi:small nuclear ribonucleoprotein (snRNP)-like protein
MTDLEATPIESKRDHCISYLRSLLNQQLKVELSDGRLLVGQLLCTDRDQNIILVGCSEHAWLPAISLNGQHCPSDSQTPLEHEVRLLGLVVIPGEHIRRLSVGHRKAIGTTESDCDATTDEAIESS